jgi:hypothetical protein
VAASSTKILTVLVFLPQLIGRNPFEGGLEADERTRLRLFAAPPAPGGAARTPTWRGRLELVAALYMMLRTEHRTPGKVGVGVGVGVFVGARLGVHFPIAVLLATLSD